MGPRLSNRDALNALYSENTWRNDTPTGDSIDAVVNDLLLPLGQSGSMYILLATDGKPDRCEERSSKLRQPSCATVMVGA